MDETGKAVPRRLRDPAFAGRYFVGEGIDIGSGADNLGRYAYLFPGMTRVRGWDADDGDATTMQGLAPESFDFVHSSHCLEHLMFPDHALGRWFRLVRPGGHLVVVVPDEDMYEQGQFPVNLDHKCTFTLYKPRSWSPVSWNVLTLVTKLGPEAELLKAESLHYTYDWGAPPVDQTVGVAESAIEFVVRKRPASEVAAGGRLRG
ncbi:MAG: SAM-dependent methyltransferases [uncultured Gemmatimonadaceae bacterium]|uniref:SAM-dependent methyltransferases n=1 Tax=uncultured Gemmatimonadaceae bacterium TaxID=246130 RepID=A0A6J4L8E3_9BACT|nr:MAG: SAM-dependent methyltransferases [uncultured Gemmatimonadaceae bacterium]